MTDTELQYSSHCQWVSSEGRTVRLEIYGTGENDWILEVVDEYGNSTVWDEPFKTDEAAYGEFNRTLQEEGIDALIGEPSKPNESNDEVGA